MPTLRYHRIHVAPDGAVVDHSAPSRRQGNSNHNSQHEEVPVPAQREAATAAVGGAAGASSRQPLPAPAPSAQIPRQQQQQQASTAQNTNKAPTVPPWEVPRPPSPAEETTNTKTKSDTRIIVARRPGRTLPTTQRKRNANAHQRAAAAGAAPVRGVGVPPVATATCIDSAGTARQPGAAPSPTASEEAAAPPPCGTTADLPLAGG